MNSYLSTKMMMGAAVIGLVGAAGMFLYEQIYAEKRRAMLVKEVARLDKQVSTMRSELEALRELQKETHIQRLKQKKVRRRELKPKPVPSGDDAPEQSYASDSEYFTDYQSIVGTDAEMDSDQFYDVHTDEEEDGTLREPLSNGHVSNPLDEDSSDKIDLPKSPAKNST